MIRRALRFLPLMIMPLAGCAQQYHPPVIRYDDAVQATRLLDPPKPVQVVEVPKPLPLPGQLKPLPSRRAVHPASEVADPTARVTQANLAARIQPTRAGFINAVQVYPYSPGALYQVYTAPGEITDIMLQQGEKLVGTGPVAAGDTVRWIIGDTESGAGASKRIHILVKPTRPDLTTNLIVNTDRRTYLAELRSTPATYMASVSWDYPEDDLIALRRQDNAAEDEAPIETGLNLDSLNFRYAVQPVKGGTPPWLPSRAFDDGHKVYIAFPSGIGQGELPPLFVLGADGGPELVNYRVRQNWMIVDRLFAAAELRLGDKQSEQRVRIVRTDGRRS
ncbi:P-type conjugative transfer protein TrbG [Novacetimonas hansenii]|uniref:P-type conjugative transfer protein TrbG n=2 Tax=Novacetimonas hansenii TaxID=436 RepID=A0ABQ0SEC4_NOVHA|nr:P-type conjugative transfer protein TrbG [Novacetimonas hansenii]EFG84836.1 putative type IV secretion system [Novacetimonas hansenii ATCC 23769]GAN84180.1 secretion system type IV conjugal transfer protein TrbG [Novacetimonas hansenii JCM 7643]GBQ60791.1 conjugal transfer protein TrbG [Novacetimonas hansenii NRIC 0243]GEC63674.1 P-type conjugative transfer protein TrbG [Novacetimonas hansenii]